MNPHRLDGPGALRRDRTVSFTYDRKRYRGYEGDTLASALLAAGVTVVGRSFKYHRPRGIVSAGSEEPNALVELRSGARREPNTRATTVELFEGLEACSQNAWPSLQFDVGAINSRLSRLLVAGFYYKTFMWPAAWWEKLYEPAIRRAAGLGRASGAADPDEYETVHAFCDVLVIGGGPAGLAAALVAGRSGARVLLCDEDFLLGGRLNGERHLIDGEPASDWARRTVAELRSLAEVRVLPRTTVFGAYDGSTFGAIERVADHLPVPAAHQPRQRYWKIVARCAVLAAGAQERSIVFGGNDRPGVMLASAVRTYVNRFRVTPGRRTGIFTSGDDGWKTAMDLSAAGVEVAVIVEARQSIPALLLEQARRCGIEVMPGAQIVGTRGGKRLEAVEVRAAGGRLRRVHLDALAVAGGWSPHTALTTHLGGRPRWSEAISGYVPGELPGSMRAVGAAAGEFSLAGALRSGAEAGRDAGQAAGFAPVLPMWRTEEEGTGAAALWFVSELRGKAFVDLQHDVTAEDVALAAREGFRSAEHLKRYTTLGMGTDQGRTAQLNGQALLAALTQRELGQLGTIASRPPFTPVAIGALAGRARGTAFRPCRHTPSHRWAEARGAVFVDAGPWRRARWFPLPGETDWQRTVNREVQTVRTAVGICDVSTLGKIDVQGGDATEFLERLYANSIATLAVGRVRYGLLLREDGIVLDDGTVARLGESHYLLSTSTAHAATVMAHLTHAQQVLWPRLDVQLTSVTEHWAQYAIAGPHARALLERLFGESLDLSNAQLPHLACAQFPWAGRSARLFRISFCGELGYELAVPARHAHTLLEALMVHGEGFGVMPYGTEALGVMRIEKGHVAGPEINGTTTAADLGLGRLVSTRKDFLGRLLAQRPGLTASDRPVLVGLKPLDPRERLASGAHLVRPAVAVTAQNDEGFVSSATFSTTLGQWIGLGFLSCGRERHGERVRACDPLRGWETTVEVVDPVFYDADGQRVRS